MTIRFCADGYKITAPTAETDTFRPSWAQHDTREGEQQCVVYDYPTLTDDPRHDLEAPGMWGGFGFRGLGVRKD